MSLNKQPFYCVVSFLFTATREISEAELEHALEGLRVIPDVLDKTVQIEAFECEPGDPADLL